MYYERQKNIKLLNSEWSHITFLDLSHYQSKLKILRQLHYDTSLLCEKSKRNFNTSEILQACKQFDQTTLSYLLEIESNHYIWTYIVQNILYQTQRVRRSISDSLKNVVTKLLGTTLTINPDFIMQHIVGILKSKSSATNIEDSRIRLVQARI